MLNTSNKHKVDAHFSTSRIQLKELINDKELGQVVKREKSYLLFEYQKHQYIYVKDYGGIAFLGFEKNNIESILQSLHQNYLLEFSESSDTMMVCVGTSDTEEYGQINVPILNHEVAHIICLNMAQSAALFHYQSLSDNLLENTRKHTNELEEKGKVSLKKKRLMKYIGSTLNIKNKISENLFVFATPMLAYENEIINHIDLKLNEELEIKYRYNAIKEQLNIIHENLDLFKDMSMHQHSSNLEWIIIWLILFEVIHVIIDQLF